MNHEQIKCMRDYGMHIGLHGYDHYWLGNLEDAKMHEDVSKALDCMSDFLNVQKWVMNYPYGSQNDNVVNYIKNQGCKLGLVTEVRKVEICKDNRYLLPRFDTNDFPPKSENYIHLN